MLQEGVFDFRLVQPVGPQLVLEIQVGDQRPFARNEQGGVYTFHHSGPLDAVSTPWVELRFPPNEERRIVFDSGGVWRAPAAG